MFTAIAILFSLAAFALMTLSIAGAIQANRKALPFVVGMFIAILLFGTLYGG